VLRNGSNQERGRDIKKQKLDYALMELTSLIKNEGFEESSVQN